MNLLEVTKFLSQADGMLVIYATQPWTPESEAIFAWFPEDLDAPDHIGKMTQFTHVSEVEGLMDRWIEMEKPSLREQCEWLIWYLSNPEWVGWPPANPPWNPNARSG